MVASFILLIAAQACSCVANRLRPLQAWHGLAPHAMQGPLAPHTMQGHLLQTPVTVRKDALVRGPHIHMSIDSDIPDAGNSSESPSDERKWHTKHQALVELDKSAYNDSSYNNSLSRVLGLFRLFRLLWWRLFEVGKFDNTGMVDGVPYYLRMYRHNLDKQRTSVWEAQNWVSSEAQDKRFAVLANQFDFHGKTVLDVGCGQGDFAKYLEMTGVVPSRLFGVDGIPEFVQSARQTAPPWAEYVLGDFVGDPSVLGSEWDIVILSGSLTTLEPAEQLRVLANCWRVSRRGMAFSFPPTSETNERFANAYPMVWKMNWPGGRHPLLREYADNPCGGGVHPGQEENCDIVWTMWTAQMIDWGNRQAGVESVELVDQSASGGDITITMRRETDSQLKEATNPLQSK